MTREEAIAKLPEMEVRTRGDIIWLLDCLTILGLLTLDEPKTAEEEFIDVLTGKHLYVSNYGSVIVAKTTAQSFLEHVRLAGFKITKA